MNSYQIILKSLKFLIGLIIQTYSTRETHSSYGVPNGSSKYAIITLVTGPDVGFVAGALALGQSLLNVNTTHDKICMVTKEIDQKSRDSLSRRWVVVKVDEYICLHKNSLDKDMFDLSNQKYVQGVQRWSKTCTKFRAWLFTQYQRVIFIDSDTLVLENIDDAIFRYTNASFAACPETWPPDTFNSGFMVLNPSLKTFNELVTLNERLGSSEGGDQGILNNGYCPNWFFVGNDDASCGRLPWIYNVEAVHYEKYKTWRLMNNSSLPAVIHFVSDGKPWKVLQFIVQIILINQTFFRKTNNYIYVFILL